MDKWLRKDSRPSESEINRRYIHFLYEYFSEKRSYFTDRTSSIKIAKAKLAEYEKLTVQEFKQSNGVRLKSATNFSKIYKPSNLDPVIISAPFYFRISNRTRIFGFMLDENFYITQIDEKHKIQ